VFNSIVFVGCFILGLWGCPKWGVYSSELSGKSKLAEASSSRRIAVEEAKAKLDAAKHLSDAEIERARGVAEANRIIGKSLKNNDGYLHYLWIQGLHDGNSETIYVPTEANMPIMEATRRRK